MTAFCYLCTILICCVIFFFQAEDGIRDLVRSRGLGDVYKRQLFMVLAGLLIAAIQFDGNRGKNGFGDGFMDYLCLCLLYTSDAADERSSVDLGGRRIIKKKNP